MKTVKEIFDFLILETSKTKINCNVKLYKSEITFELGFSYRDTTVNKIADIIFKNNIDVSIINFCAFSHGGIVLEKKIINKGK